MYTGGAERTADELQRVKPSNVQIWRTAPGDIRPEVDLFVIHNCTTYLKEDIEVLSTKPCIKVIHDIWPNGDSYLRRWLLDHAHLVFCSPLHRQEFDWPHDGDATVLPPAIDLRPFAHAKAVGWKRDGTVWVGSMMTGGKGVRQVEAWAEENVEQVDFYGFGRYRPVESALVRDRGKLDPADVPQVLAKAARFIFLPLELEPFGRVAAEAWYTGCKLVLNDRVGAKYYIERNDYQAIETAGGDFWDLALSLL